MRGYAVHLLFHLLAVVCGATFGVAAVLWSLHRSDANTLYLAVGAAGMGVVVLLIQALYIAAQQPRRRPAPILRQGPPPPSVPRMKPVERRTPTLPDMAPVVPRPDPDQVDQETKSTALDALDEHTRQG